MLWQTAQLSGPATASSKGPMPGPCLRSLSRVLPSLRKRGPPSPVSAGSASDGWLASRADLELLPFHTALAGMHVVIVLLRLVTPMALAVVGDLLLHAPACPRLIGFHLQAPVGRSLWLHAGHGFDPPRATRSAVVRRWPGAR